MLHSLEKGSWNIHAWECETQRPGGTVWPLREKPYHHYSQNQHIAELVASHFRVVSKGHTPFAIDWNQVSNRRLLQDNLAVQKLVVDIQRELKEPTSGTWDLRYRQRIKTLNLMSIVYCRHIHSRKAFKREDVASLNYLYTRKLVID